MKLLSDQKRLVGCKNGMDLLYHNAKYDGDLGSCAGCRRKSVMFFCLFVMLWNYKVCDNGKAMKQYYYQNNYGVVVCRKVCSCAPILTIFCGPTKFSLRGKFIPKIAIFRDFCGCRPTFLKP